MVRSRTIRLRTVFLAGQAVRTCRPPARRDGAHAGDHIIPAAAAEPGAGTDQPPLPGGAGADQRPGGGAALVFAPRRQRRLRVRAAPAAGRVQGGAVRHAEKPAAFRLPGHGPGPRRRPQKADGAHRQGQGRAAKDRAGAGPAAPPPVRRHPAGQLAAFDRCLDRMLQNLGRSPEPTTGRELP